MQLEINRQQIELKLPVELDCSGQQLRILERVDHLLRANPSFQERYPRAKLERAEFTSEQPNACCLSYSSMIGRVEIRAQRAPITAIDLEQHLVSIAR